MLAFHWWFVYYCITFSPGICHFFIAQRFHLVLDWHVVLHCFYSSDKQFLEFYLRVMRIPFFFPVLSITNFQGVEYVDILEINFNICICTHKYNTREKCKHLNKTGYSTFRFATNGLWTNYRRPVYFFKLLLLHLKARVWSMIS